MVLSEVTLTLVDPEVVEAAEFVLNGGADETSTAGPIAVPDSAFGATTETAFNTEGTENTENAVENSNDAISESGDAATSLHGEPKFLKKKRAAEKPGMHLKPGEVVVGRRLYRSGQSECLINGRVVRLRDIQDLFMAIGLGPDSYAIIEQGRIGLILSSQPTDRRAIIEEAAGITKFKTTPRRADAKLQSSKLNLSR